MSKKSNKPRALGQTIDADGNMKFGMLEVDEDGEETPVVHNLSRNLTAEAIRLKLESDLESKLMAIPADEIVEVARPKLNEDGNRVVDEQGFSILVPSRVLKREWLERSEREKIEKIVAANCV